MTTKQFKIWLLKNDTNQKQIAEKLGLSENTITNYCKSERFPFVFVLALVAIERGLNITDLEL